MAGRSALILVVLAVAVGLLAALAVLGGLAFGGHLPGLPGAASTAAQPGERFQTVPAPETSGWLPPATPGPSGGTGTPVAPPPSTRACPDEVRQDLPVAEASGATLAAGYETARFRVDVCATPTGRLYYHGVAKADDTQRITLPAASVAGGYLATNSSQAELYRYQITTRDLVVSRNGTVILDDPVLAVR